MTPDQVQQAIDLLARRTDLQQRLSAVSQATTLVDVANTLTGTGLEDTMLAQSRTDVSDFLQVTLTDVETQLTALGVSF